MKASELKDLSIEELRLKADDLRSELFNLRLQHATNQLENTAKLSHIRKDLARISTVIRDKELREEGVNSG
jgi:large subunit ribosomal protein L29